MPDESQFSYQTDSWGLGEWMRDFGLVEEEIRIAARNGGLTESLTDQDRLNQVETSEGSYQTKSGGGRARLTLAQKRENKRQCDYRYRQKRKITADEQTAENKCLKVENERLSAENRMLKEQMGSLLPNGQLPAEAPQRQDSYITQSTGKQLEHQSVSVQNDGDGMRLKASGGRDENHDSKAEAEPSSGKPVEEKTQPTEPPKQDYNHVQARRVQATNSHRGRRETITEKIKILKDLVPGCSKVTIPLLLGEIINYIPSLQGQVEFLSTKLAAVNSRMYPAIEVFPPKDDHHGINSGAVEMLSGWEMNESQNLQEMVPVNVVLTNDYVTEDQKNSETGTCCNDETPITELLMKIDADDESKVNFSDFSGLDGERIKVGKYSFPLSLHPTVERIIDVCGDISATSKMNPCIAETTYIMFCASVKEMSDLQLEQVTEDRILKWRDAIRDALRISFKVDFAMEHLKKIACAYIGLMERQKLENVAMRINKLETDLRAGKEEHAKICEQSKVYIDVADEFNGKPVSSGMFQSFPTTKCA